MQDAISRRIATAIWNGPFHIGPLQQPVSVGDVLLKLLETAWRLVVAVIALALAIAIAATVWSTVIAPKFFPSAASKISVIAEYDDGTKPLPPAPVPLPGQVAPPKPYRCNKDYPIKVTFQNNSERPINVYGFSLKAYLNDPKNDLITGNNSMFQELQLPGGYWQIECESFQLANDVDPYALNFEAYDISASYRD
jgi:hypothetical protein